MTTCSVGFLAFCASLAILFPMIRGARPRQALFLAANLFFLATVVQTKRDAAGLAGFVMATYLALLLVRARPSRWTVPAVVAAAIAVFLVLKRYSFLEGMFPEPLWERIPEVVGISYMLFRFIHMAVDLSQGMLPPFGFASYAGYQLLFFTVTAGPIQRYNEFYAF